MKQHRQWLTVFRLRLNASLPAPPPVQHRSLGGICRNAAVIVGAIGWVAMMSGPLSAATPDATSPDRTAYRASLVELMAVLRDVHALAGSDAPGSRVQIDRAARWYGALSDRQVDALSVDLPASRLSAIVVQARRRMDEAAASRAKAVVVANPDVTPAFCSDYPAPVVLTALVTKHVAQHVIDGLEFTCQESIGGFNAALGCEGPEIASAAADIASELADFCGNQQSAATNTAVLQTERSIGQHLDAQLDAVLSTRATQLSIDAAGIGATASNEMTADIRSRLDQDVVQTDAQISDLLDDLADLGNDIADIQSRTDDVVFRVQVSQVNVENIQDRAADLQQKSVALENVMSASRAVAEAAVTDAAALSPSIQAMARQQRRDELAAALGDANARVSGFALPGIAGGRIEEAREVLISDIIALQAVGQGNTAQALSLLAAGDQHYNAGRYTDAWRQFSAAYRALDPHQASTPGALP